MEENDPKEEGEIEDNAEESSAQYVKSRAVVKYSSVNTPAQFAELKCNTDLKLPPSNWLKSSTKSYGLHHGLYKSNVFTSFRLAHMFSDCLGEVDVVSDAENIKKLLKIPYNKAAISMMVHRIENTLLIDEFDIHKHLLLRAENDRQWLRKFFLENVIQSLQGKALGVRPNRSILQQKSLVSKFLHYSLDGREGGEGEESCPQLTSPPSSGNAICSTGPPLPEPDLRDGLPDATSDYKFIRNVIWTFEDIQMLLGTDMPIFGGSTHPCISLRLRDIEKPISVLTGIDYWLDNLMSNVPEVVMCYHLDGIVQKYELIKTEDLPQLPDAKFSPKLIRDVAQNILSFLKSNATKAGHTYWLFKARNDDVVKLYDLSTLYSETLVDKEQNPFTVPVGLLLYRVARNLKQSTDKSSYQPGTIRMLLKNCVTLLPKEKYSQIVTSAHYMLSDLYVPSGTDITSPQLVDEQPLSDMDQGDEDDCDDSAPSQVPVKALCASNFHTTGSKFRPPPLTGTLTERCEMALYHVIEGLQCLQFFDAVNKSTKEEPEPQMSTFSQPIPMPYGKLNSDGEEKEKTEEKQTEEDHEDSKTKKKRSPSKLHKKGRALLCLSSEQQARGVQADPSTWRGHLEALLVNKGCLVYAILSEYYASQARFGLSLRYAGCLLEVCSWDPELMCAALRRAGDDCLSIVKDWGSRTAHLEEYMSHVPSISQQLSQQIQELVPLPSDFDNIEEMLYTSRDCYKTAKKLIPNDKDILLRMGNIQNEIATMLIGKAQELFMSKECDQQKLEKVLSTAERELKEGIRLFEKLSDRRNLALLYTNQGKIMRIRTHSSFSSDRGNHQMAEESYLNALKALGSRKEQPDIWDAVTWELSTFFFSVANHLDKFPIHPSKVEEASKEVVELLNRSLKYCDLTTPGPRQLHYQFRAALIHLKLASQFFIQYKVVRKDENRGKFVLKLALSHYSKAYDLFNSLECPVDLLRVLLGRISLFELQAEDCTNVKQKIKLLQTGINFFTDMLPAFVSINEKSEVPPSDQKSSQDDSENKEQNEILSDLETAVCSILKEMLCIKLKNKFPEQPYKDAYALMVKRENKPLPQLFIDVINVLLEKTTKLQK